jgi:hypothetical protein
VPPIPALQRGDAGGVLVGIESQLGAQGIQLAEGSRIRVSVSAQSSRIGVPR